MTSNSGFRRLVCIFAYWFTLQQIFLCFPANVPANPTGGEVTAGQAEITQQGATLNVTQATSRAIINWQGFSINAGETTQFIQPSSDSAVLNRVQGFGPSRLDGSLIANGQVFLINPNGVLIGQDGRIDTGGFFASTLDIPDLSFMAGGDLEFVGDSAAGIKNLGVIKATTGDIVLAARTVENKGLLQSPNGVAGLAAGNEVLYRPLSDERIFVKSALTMENKPDGVTNTGIINAAQAELRAAGGNVYALAVNNGGAIHATGTSKQDGRVLLRSAGGNIQTTGTISAVNVHGAGGKIRVQAEGDGPASVTVSGDLMAKGEESDTTGGSVTVTGDSITLTGTAGVNVSGDAGGGLVRIGGDYQGENPEIFNASTTIIESGAEINANAITNGDGGRIIIWSDDYTGFEGTFLSRGGQISGNGGFAEVSGHRLNFKGTGDMQAPNGHTGTLLIDPNDVYISNLYGSASGEPTYFNTDGVSALLGTMHLEVSARNVIYFESGTISWTSGNKLSLEVRPLAGYDAAGLFIGANQFLLGRVAPQINAPIGALYLEPWGKLQDYSDVAINAGSLTIKPVVNPPSNTASASGIFSLTGKVTTPALTILSGGHTSCASGKCSFSMNNTQNSISSIVIGDGAGHTPKECYDTRFDPAPLTVQALPGNFSIYSSSSTSVETKGWVQFEGDVTIRSGGNLTLKNFIGFDTQSLNEQLVLSAGGNFSNADTASAFQVPATGETFYSYFPWASRTLIFSTDPRLDTPGKLATYNPMDGRIYGKSYANLSSIPSGDWSVYTLVPVVTISPSDTTKGYGEANPAPPYSSTGVITGDSLTGTPVFSTDVTEQTGAGTYDITINDIGTLSGPSGYQFLIDNDPAGSLTVTKRDLYIYLQKYERIYGEENPTSFTAVYSGLMDWDIDPISGLVKEGVLNGVQIKAFTSLTSSEEVTQQTGVGDSYWIRGIWQDTFSSQNYNLKWVYPETMTITPAPLTVAADNITRRIGDSNTYFTVSCSGLMDWDMDLSGDPLSGVLNGLIIGTTATDESPSGNYPIIPYTAWASNYDITFVDGTLTIKEPYPLTITAGDFTRTYGSDNPSFTALYSGFQDGDTEVVVTGLSLTTTANTQSPVGFYAITPDNATLPPYYTATYVPGQLTVNPASLTITADNFTRRIGDPNPAFTAGYTGLMSWDMDDSGNPAAGTISGLGFQTSALADSLSGSYYIRPVSASASNYTISYVDGTLTIKEPYPFYITIDDASRAYGEVNPSFTASFSGFQDGDTATAVTALNLTTTANTQSPVGTYNITLGSVTLPPYYSVTYVPGQLTVNPASLTITANNASRRIDSPDPAFSAIYTGLKSWDTDDSGNPAAGTISGLTFQTSALADSLSGSYYISPGSASASNYTISYVDGTLTILEPSDLLISADNAFKVYGDPNPVFTLTYDGFQGVDTEAVVSGVQIMTTATHESQVGHYAITPSGGNIPRYYTPVYGSGYLQVTPASLTITADNFTRRIGDPNPAFTAGYTGLMSWDMDDSGNPVAGTISGLGFQTSALADSLSGSYYIRPGSASASNYTISYVDGTLTIKEPYPFYITANNSNRIYGEANPSFTASFSGFQDGDTAAAVTALNLTTTANTQSPVGTYNITLDNVTLPPYYSVTYAPGQLTVNPASLTITADNFTRRIGDPNPAFTAGYTGIMSWDMDDSGNPAAGTISGLDFQTSALADSLSGSYYIRPGSASASNYTISYVDGTLTIKEPYPFYITIDDASRAYGEVNPAFTASFSGFQDGDTAAAVTALNLTATANVQSPAGTYNITLGGASLPPYYSVTYVPGRLTVMQRDLILRADNITAQYGTIPTFTYSTENLLSWDSLINAPTLTGMGSDVGEHSIILTGGDINNNYRIIRQNGVLTVTPAPLFITANDIAMFEGQPYPDFTASYLGLMYYDTGNVVQGLNLVVDKNFTVSGSNTLSSIIQSGPLTAANYYPITFTPGTLAIQPALPEIIELDIITVDSNILIHQPGQTAWTLPFGVPESGAQALRYVAKNLILKLGLNVDNIDTWLSSPENRALMSGALLDFLNAPLLPGELYDQREGIKDALQSQIREMKVKAAEEAVAAYNAWKEERKVEFQKESGKLMTLFGDVAVPDEDFEAQAMATMITTGISAATLASVATVMSASGMVLAGSSLAGCTFVTTAFGTSLVTAQTAAALAATGGQLGATIGVSTAGTILGPGAIVVAAVVIGACRISQVVEKFNVEEKYAHLVENAANFDIDTLINGDETSQNELASYLMLASMKDNTNLGFTINLPGL